MVIVLLGNAGALWLANHYVPGFIVNGGLLQFILLALILALLNFILKPILDLIFAPAILLTLGFALFLVNMLIVWLLPMIASRIDFLHGSISIQGILALVLGTLIISVINFIIHLV